MDGDERKEEYYFISYSFQRIQYWINGLFDYNIRVIYPTEEILIKQQGDKRFLELIQGGFPWV